MSDYKVGDVNIEEITLKSKDGKRSFNFQGQVRLIDIFESITQPILYGEIEVHDAVGVRKGFPIIGEETFILKFNTPGIKSIDLDLRVFEISNIQMMNNNIEGYILKVCSPELLSNASVLVNKRFKNQITASIKNIISSDLKSKKLVEVEDSRGIDDHLISQLTPLETIDKLRHRAVSAKNYSSSYCFFENAKGFHFVTLEGLIREGKKKIADKVFFFDDNIDVEVGQIRFRDIIKYRQIQDQNSIDKIQAGSIKNVVNKFDILTGNIKQVTYSNGQFDDKFVNTADQPKTNTSKFLLEHGQTTSRKFLVPYTSDGDEDFIGEKIGILHAFVEKITQNIMVMEIYGDSSITIGDIIACNFAVVGSINANKITKIVSNNYLISKVRHMITVSNRSVYHQSLEILNSSYDY